MVIPFYCRHLYLKGRSLHEKYQSIILKIVVADSRYLFEIEISASTLKQLLKVVSNVFLTAPLTRGIKHKHLKVGVVRV